MGKFYKKAYDNRHKNDYTITYKPQKEDIIKAHLEASSFIEVIKSYIKTQNKK